MTWNYRVKKHKDGSYGIHEVYYDMNGNPELWSEEPFIVGNDLDDLRAELKHMMDCLKAPII